MNVCHLRRHSKRLRCHQDDTGAPFERKLGMRRGRGGKNILE